MTRAIYTIGHSNHTLEKFLYLLESHSVEVVADVRSIPQSTYTPQFNHVPLKQALAEQGVLYVFLGEELGARSQDPCCYLDGRADYDRISQTELFVSGIQRLVKGAWKHRIALTCAEKDPIECHRTILVARHLMLAGFDIKHIMADGSIETHDETMVRVSRHLRLPQPDMLISSEDIVELAYQKQGEAIAYRPSESSSPRKRRAVYQ